MYANLPCGRFSKQSGNRSFHHSVCPVHLPPGCCNFKPMTEPNFLKLMSPPFLPATGNCTSRSLNCSSCDSRPMQPFALVEVLANVCLQDSHQDLYIHANNRSDTVCWTDQYCGPQLFLPKHLCVIILIKPWSHDRKTTTLWRGQSRGTCHVSDTEDKKRKSNSVIQNRGSIKLHNAEYMH